jgi:hypothetical protein
MRLFAAAYLRGGCWHKQCGISDAFELFQEQLGVFQRTDVQGVSGTYFGPAHPFWYLAKFAPGCASIEA